MVVVEAAVHVVVGDAGVDADDVYGDGGDAAAGDDDGDVVVSVGRRRSHEHGASSHRLRRFHMRPRYRAAHQDRGDR